MGADSVLGLLLQISADPSKAQEAIDQFSANTGKAFQRASSDGPPQMDKALLTNRESVRLLSEEMGVHMPRAVSSALAEIMPGINAVGPALLGAFAVREVISFTEAIVKSAREIQGLAEAEKQLQAIAKENEKHLEAMAKVNEKYGYTQLALLRVQIANEEEGIRNAERWIRLGEMMGGYFYDLMFKLIGGEAKLDAERKALAQTTKEYDDIVNILGEDETKRHQLAVKEAREEEKDRGRQLGTENWLAAERIRIMHEAGKEVETLRKQQEQAAAAAQRQAKAELEFAIDLGKYDIVDQAHLRNLQEGYAKLAPTLRSATEQTIHLSAARNELILVTQDAYTFEEQWTKAVGKNVEAVQADLVASTEALSAGLAGLIGGRKAQAAVEAIWEIAKGIACLAEGTWPPNPAAIIAAGLHFEAAAQYAILAGKSAGHHHAAAGGGAGPSAGRSEYGGGRSPWEPQTLAEGAASAGGRFGSAGSGVVIIRGTADFENYVAAAVNGAVSRGVNVTATSSQRGSPVGH